jgi:hypothetical protein
MPIIRPKDIWLVPLSLISIVLIAIGQIPLGFCLFVVSCFVILKIYGMERMWIHVALSSLVLVFTVKIL